MELVHKEKMRSIKQSLNSLQFFILALNVSLFSKQCGNVHTPWHSLTSALQLMLLLKKKVSSYAFSLSSCSKLPSCAVCFFFLCLFYLHKALTGILWIRKGGWLCLKKKKKFLFFLKGSSLSILFKILANYIHSHASKKLNKLFSKLTVLNTPLYFKEILFHSACLTFLNYSR